MKSTSPGPAKRRARRFAIWVLAAALLAGCFGGSSTEEASEAAPKYLAPSDINPSKNLVEGGSLRIGLETFPANFNPVHTDGAISTATQILAPTFGGALRILDDGTWKVDPNYARSVEVKSTDPLTIRVKLNKSAKWQDGSTIDSSDMVAFVKAMQSEEFAAAATPAFQQISAVKKDGDFGYSVVFTKPTADWPAAIYPALPSKATNDPAVFNESFKTKAPPANGPFQVASIDRKTSTISLEPNPNWWGKEPLLDSIVWRIADAGVLAKAYRAKELDAMWVTAQNRNEFINRSGLRSASGSQWSHLTLNGASGPLQNAKVRRAIALAIDRDAIVRATTKQHLAKSQRLDSVVLVPGQAGYLPSPAMKQDQAEARKLLAAAGWELPTEGATAERKGDRLVLQMVVPSAPKSAKERASLIAADLREVGIKVKVKAVDEEKFFDEVIYPLDFDLTTFTWETESYSIAAAKKLFSPIDSPTNFTGRTSPTLTKAFNSALETIDDKDRAEKISQVDEAARHQALILPLAVWPKVQAVRTRLANYGPTTFADLDWTIVAFMGKREFD